MTTTFEHSKKTSWWVDALFYVSQALLLIAVFCYAVFAAKVFFQQKKLTEIKTQIASYGTPQQRSDEKQVFDYKDKIDNFATLLANHKQSSNVFVFLESTTLPNVSFSNVALSQTTSDMKLVGQAQSLDTFSHQLQAFESHSQYVKSINVADSKVAPNGSVSFVITVVLNPVIFTNYHGNQ